RIGVAAEVLAALVDGVVLEHARSRLYWKVCAARRWLGWAEAGAASSAPPTAARSISLIVVFMVRSRSGLAALHALTTWRAHDPKKGRVFATANRTTRAPRSLRVDQIYYYISVSYEITTSRTDIGLEPPPGRPAAPHSNPPECNPAHFTAAQRTVTVRPRK